MAFGKDDNHLNNIPSFGQGNFNQSAAATTRQRGGGGGGGGRRPYWIDNFELSTNPAVPDRFRLVRGAYKQQQAINDGNGNTQLAEFTFPFVAFREHFHGTAKKGGICSGGPMYMDRNHRMACEGCEMFWEDYQQRKAKKDSGDQSKGPNRISMQDKYAFTVLDYAYYFEMPQVNARTNQYELNPRTNQPYMNWEKALNPQDPRYQGRNWKHGDVRPWAIGQTWKDTLSSFSLAIGKSCASCSGRDTVYSRGWFCGNPQCHAFIFDPNNTTLSLDQQQEVTKSLFTCQHCRQTMYPIESVACSSCQNGVRASIFDVDLTGFKQQGNSNAQSQLIITGWSAPGPIVLTKPEDVEKVKPLDLLKRFAPTPVEEQRKIWNLGAGHFASQQGMPPQNFGGPPPGTPYPQQQQVQQPQPQQTWQAPPGMPQQQPGYPAPQGVPQQQYQQAYAPQPQPVDPALLQAQLQGMNPNGYNNG